MPTRAISLWLVATLMGAGLGVASCGPEQSCVVVSSDCAPLYQPTFDNIYSRTLSTSCSTNGSSCHSSEGAQGGLAFVSADQSYTALLDASSETPFVIAGDPGCSSVVLALESQSVPMPPGQPLSEAERCAIIQWIAQGAER